MTDAHDDLEALQAAATHYDLDPTEPGAEEWLRGSHHYGQTRLRLALQQTRDILWDQLARGFSAFTSALTPKETP